MLLLALAALAVPTFAAQLADTGIPDSVAVAIAYRIWNNESGATTKGLTHWNRGEEFASLGLGHFIWYPEGKRGPFRESFPSLLVYLEEHGTELPDWLKDDPHCPWPDRRAFFRDKDGPRMKELRELLSSTVYLQGRFMADRLEAALPRMLAVTPRAMRGRIEARFDSLAVQEQGLYALVDYVNFKGEGLAHPESYKGRGWGLLQVLAGMRGEPEGADAVAEFSRSAARVLARRVRNAWISAACSSG